MRAHAQDHWYRLYYNLIFMMHLLALPKRTDRFSDTPWLDIPSVQDRNVSCSSVLSSSILDCVSYRLHPRHRLNSTKVWAAELQALTLNPVLLSVCKPLCGFHADFSVTGPHCEPNLLWGQSEMRRGSLETWRLLYVFNAFTLFCVGLTGLLHRLQPK